MVTRNFDEARIKLQLDGMLVPSRVAFAAACAERLRPAYLAFVARVGRADSDNFERILDRLWSDLTDAPMTNDELSECAAASISLMPHEDDVAWIDEQAYAEDACAALAYALRCRGSGESQEAAWAARRAYEAVDYYVTHHRAMRVNALGEEDALPRHLVIQAELARQNADLRDLDVNSPISLRAAIAGVRARAEHEAKCMF